MVWPLSSQFHHPFPSFPMPVRIPQVNPETGNLIQVCFNEKWLPYVLGALWQLCLYSTWDTADEGEMQEVLSQANHLIWLFQSAKPCVPIQYGSAGAEGAEDIMIRQNPDNPCLLETSINGTDWCPFADISLCLNAPVQPAAGSEQPPAGGGSACYNAYMPANERWLLPTLVNAGDVITCSDFTGAGNDGTVVWTCASGGNFALGTCGTITTLDAADPKPTAPHMTIVAYINGVYYDAYAAPITVPGGVANAQVTFQVNDSNILDNSGSYAWQVCVQNNQVATWEHVFSFAAADYGWQPSHPQSDTNAAHWQPGEGWKADCVLGDNNGNKYQMDNIRKTAQANTTLTYVEVLYDRDATGTGATSLSDAIQVPGTNLFLRQSSYPTGTSLLMAWSGSQALNNGQVLAINLAQAFTGSGGAACPIVSTFALIKRITVRGTGNDPFPMQ